MVQFWEFGSGFNDHFTTDHRGRSEGESVSESGSENDDYLVKKL